MRQSGLRPVDRHQATAAASLHRFTVFGSSSRHILTVSVPIRDRRMNYLIKLRVAAMLKFP